jgi:hypothetical protein
MANTKAMAAIASSEIPSFFVMISSFNKTRNKTVRELNQALTTSPPLG